MNEQAGIPNWENRTLFRGDNLEFMRSMNSKSVHLIATDPPFNKGRDFHATPVSLASGASFADRWRWDEDVQPDWLDQTQDDWPAAWGVIEGSRMAYGDDMAAFLCFMAVRLMAMHRILCADGSIYLHCDPTASHYLKMLMDAIFGRKQFRNEIVWEYGLGGSSKKFWSRKHDILLFYTKSDRYYFDKPTMPATSQRMRGQNKGMKDVWSDIPSLNNMATERTGYPTQKPLALYQRIIQASSNPGDIDPFAGCATTPIAAEMEGRNWVACDEWEGAYDVVTSRLEAMKVSRGGQEEMAYYPCIQRMEPLIRTDAGETAAPALKSLRRKYTPPTMKRTEMVAALIARDGMQCQGCGRQFDNARYFELDHKLPRSEGGSNDLENRVLLCGPCNRTKSNTLTLTGLRKHNRKDGFLVASLT